ncbi:hypothetical protein E2K98_19205 [Bacillus salipaludis]|uniref:Uncharacterized protein n=1 Tax=Bacillus salipaludis TaxID=2547811 RepID=A0A4R5VPD7_9BACI|nr:hypothetical protein E2K98_19205 [Bacillus salipaludis]
MFFTYPIWYSIGMFFIEGMRTYSLMLTSHLRLSQVISIVLLMTVRRMKGFSKDRYLNTEV